MKEPIKVISYECPYCHHFERYDIDEVLEHIKVCEWNDELPPKDCMNCGHHSTSKTRELCGHDRGRQVYSQRLWHHCEIKGKDCENRYGFYCSFYKELSAHHAEEIPWTTTHEAQSVQKKMRGD